MDECHTWYNGSVWYKDLPNKIYVGQWPIFHGPVILPYICKTIWWMKIILDLMDQCDTKIDHIKYTGQWPTFHGPVILLYNYLENYLMDEGHTLDNESVWHKDWPHKIFIGHWPIFYGPVILLNILRLFDGGILYLGQWISLTQRLASLNKCGSVTYISWSSNFVLYLEDYLMDEGHRWYNGTVWHKNRPHKIYIGQWSIFCDSNST